MRTRVGYSGGTTANPTYSRIGDHAETVDILFDPKKISYRKLLDVFWSSHNPLSVSFSTQYMNAVFYRDAAQKKAAEETRDAIAKRRRADIKTKVIPFGRFYVAEDYHQKYNLRGNSGLMAEFKKMYPDPGGFRDSTAAARVNGYIAGHAPDDLTADDLSALGLTEGALVLVKKLVGLD